MALCSTTLPIDALVVCKVSDSAAMLTVSVTPPTSKDMLITSGVSTTKIFPVLLAVLKPGSATVIA
jgi:hypothetical protein